MMLMAIEIFFARVLLMKNKKKFLQRKLFYLCLVKKRQINKIEMKKFLFSFVLVALCATIFAQRLVPEQYGHKLLQSKDISQISSLRAPFDTMGWTPGYLPEFGSPTAAFHIYGLTSEAGDDLGYWFGVNYDAANNYGLDFWSMAYIVDNPVKITGVIIGIAGKEKIAGGANSYIELSIYDMVDDKAKISASATGPGPGVYGGSPLSVAQINIDNIDTTWVGNLGFNYVALSSPLSVSEDFAIVSNFKNMRLAMDTAYMYCDEPGNHGGMNYSFVSIDPSQYWWFTLSYASNGNLDVNLPLFAVIDMASAGINDDFYQGMKLTMSPNPVSDMLTLEYALQFNSNVKVQFIGSNGSIAKEVVLGQQNASNYYKETIDISDLASGNYFVSLLSNGNRLTKQIVVE